jgi:hypothetical protein
MYFRNIELEYQSLQIIKFNRGFITNNKIKTQKGLNNQ